MQKVLREHGLRYVAEFGRGDMKFESPSLRKLPEFIPVPEEPQFARAALAVLERAHPVPGDDEMSAVADVPAVELAEEERVKLEILLAELLQLKGRLRGALARSKG